MEDTRNTDDVFFDVLKQIEREILENKDDPDSKECLRLIDEEEAQYQREYEMELQNA